MWWGGSRGVRYSSFQVRSYEVTPHRPVSRTQVVGTLMVTMGTRSLLEFMTLFVKSYMNGQMGGVHSSTRIGLLYRVVF